jgi:hypothetical protein
MPETMCRIGKNHIAAMLFASGLLGSMSIPAAALSIDGRVQAAGGPVARSTVTLWAASAGEPRQLAQTQTGADGRFSLRADVTPGDDTSLYIVADGGEATVGKGSGDNPAITLLTVLGNKPPAELTINEMTTVASVWTHAQFLDGRVIKGHALGLKIAAGNVPSFVDLQTGGWGTSIQDPLNSSQTPTMANFATLADVLSGCATRVVTDACAKLYTAAAPPTQSLALSGRVPTAAPTDTLTAAQSIARYPWYQPGRVFALLEAFYPIPQGKTMRSVPFMPYLNFSPSAWVLPFAGGHHLRSWQARHCPCYRLHSQMCHPAYRHRQSRSSAAKVVFRLGRTWWHSLATACPALANQL